MKGTRTLYHGRVALALHPLARRRRDAPGLLLLHALGGSSADWTGAADAWPGDVFALDFSGHGQSDWLRGHGYSPEGYGAEADAALATLAETAPIHLAGAGIGAYVALLLAAARRKHVRGVLLLPGAGLAGGGALPGEVDAGTAAVFRSWLVAPEREAGGHAFDPQVSRCDHDLRPVDYAEAFAREAPPLWVGEIADPPPWLAATIRAAKARIVPAEPAAAIRAMAEGAIE